jgi:LysM repeat protein
VSAGIQLSLVLKSQSKESLEVSNIDTGLSNPYGDDYKSDESYNAFVDNVTIEAVRGVLEGLEDSKKTAYVPESGGKVIGKSGVTIAKGVDLGPKSDDEIDAFPISNEKKEKLKKLNGAKGSAALELLNTHGAVTLSDTEVKKLNEHIEKIEYTRARDNYEAATGKDFYALPVNVRNALVVASFQLGNGLYRYKKNGKWVTTNFTQELKDEDYEAAANNMANWNNKSEDGLQKRYRAQADLLRGDISIGELNERAAIHLNDIRAGRSYKPMTASETTETPVKRTHVVARGDTLSSLARKHSTTVDKLKKLNNLENDTIKIGEQLTLPEQAETTFADPRELQQTDTTMFANLFDDTVKNPFA